MFKWLKLELANEKRDVKNANRYLWQPGLVAAQREWTDSVVFPLTTLQKALLVFRGRRLQDMTFATIVAVSTMVQLATTPPYSFELFNSLLEANKNSGLRHATI